MSHISNKNLTFKKYAQEDKGEIYKLWYEVYFTEMSRNIKYADNLRKTIIDELEPDSIILTIELDGEIVGTSRINQHKGKALSYYDDFYELNSFKSDSLCIVTKYMIKQKYRYSNFGYLLALATVDFCKKSQIQWIVMDCSPALYDFFEKLGFKNHTGIKISPEYGEVKIMKFDTFATTECPLANVSMLEKNQNNIHY